MMNRSQTLLSAPTLRRYMKVPVFRGAPLDLFELFVAVCRQGLTLVHFSAQLKRFLRNKGVHLGVV
jgi:hypothetical protein